jgi:hypothetical protein
MRGLRVLSGLLVTSLLAVPTQTLASGQDSCRREMTALASESSKNPLLKLRQKVADDFPSKLKERAREITAKISDCFGSKKLTRAQQLQSQINLGLNFLVPTTSILWSHSVSAKDAELAGKKPPDFPFDLMGTVIVLYAWQSLIQCQNEMLAEASPDASYFKRSLDKYKRYLKMDVGGTFLYVGAIATEDLLRGHEVGSEEQLRELAGEGAFGFAWDTGMSVAHVMILDRVLMRYLPGGRGWITSMVKKGLFRGRFAKVGDKKLLLLTANNWAEAPGLFLDFLVRQGYVASRSFGFVQLRNSLFEDKDELPKTPIPDISD